MFVFKLQIVAFLLLQQNQNAALIFVFYFGRKFLKFFLFCKIQGPFRYILSQSFIYSQPLSLAIPICLKNMNTDSQFTFDNHIYYLHDEKLVFTLFPTFVFVPSLPSIIQPITQLYSSECCIRHCICKPSRAHIIHASFNEKYDL